MLSLKFLSIMWWPPGLMLSPLACSQVTTVPNLGYMEGLQFSCLALCWTPLHFHKQPIASIKLACCPSYCPTFGILLPCLNPSSTDCWFAFFHNWWPILILAIHSLSLFDQLKFKLEIISSFYFNLHCTLTCAKPFLIVSHKTLYLNLIPGTLLQKSDMITIQKDSKIKPFLM